MYDRDIMTEDPFMLVYCPDKYKTQRMYDEFADDSLAALRFIPDWFVTSKMFERLDTTLHAKDDKDYKVSFIANERHILTVDLNKINLDNNKNFDEDDLDTVIYVRHLAWRRNFQKRKALQKKDKQRVNCSSLAS